MKSNEEVRQDVVVENLETENKEELVSQLVKNSDEVRDEKHEESDKKKRSPYLMEIKDIIFLSILSAAIFISGVPMMFVKNIPVFGVIQLTLAFQFSLLVTIGALKVQKPGTIMYVSVILGLLHVPMFPPMGVVMIICGAVTEGLVMLFFRGYKKDIASIFGGTIWLTLSLPQLFIFYTYMYGGTLLAKNGKGMSGIEVNKYARENPAIAVAITVAVILLSIIGAVYGWLIARELRKAGVFKK